MAKRKLINPYGDKIPVIAYDTSNKEITDKINEIVENENRITIVKRGKGERTPDLTPMNTVHKEFIEMQKSRGNSVKTILYYENAYRQFMTFLVRTLPSKELLQKVKNEEQLASIFVVSILCMDNIELEYRNYLLNTVGVKEITVDTYFRAFRAFSYYCMDEGWIPYRKIKVKDTKANVKDCYTEEEIKKLLKKPTSDDFLEYRNWVIVNYLLSCGNRVGSIVNLKIKDINFDDGLVIVNTQKNKEPVTIPLIKKMRDILAEYIYFYRSENASGQAVSIEKPLFCNRFGEALTEQGLYKALSEYNKSRGVEKTSIHLFRHTFAKYWILRGGDLPSLQRVLGHKSIKMVMHYANIYSKDALPKAEEFSILANMPTTTGETIKKRGKGNKDGVRKRI